MGLALVGQDSASLESTVASLDICISFSLTYSRGENFQNIYALQIQIDFVVPRIYIKLIVRRDVFVSVILYISHN